MLKQRLYSFLAYYLAKSLRLRKATRLSEFPICRRKAMVDAKFQSCEPKKATSAPVRLPVASTSAFELEPSGGDARELRPARVGNATRRQDNILQVRECQG